MWLYFAQIPSAIRPTGLSCSALGGVRVRLGFGVKLPIPSSSLNLSRTLLLLLPMAIPTFHHNSSPLTIKSQAARKISGQRRNVKLPSNASILTQGILLHTNLHQELHVCKTLGFRAWGLGFRGLGFRGATTKRPPKP